MPLKNLNLNISGENSALSSVPAYLRVAEAIRLSIESSQITSGERIPSTRDMAESFGVHRHTVMEGLAELVAEGWLVSEQRKGYRVAEDLPQTALKKISKTRVSKTQAYQWDIKKKIELGAFQPLQKIDFNFQSGLPDLRLFPKVEFNSYLSRAMKKKSLHHLDYGHPGGEPELCEAIDACLRRLKNINNRKTIITNGSQEAIFLSFQLLLDEKDTIVVEDPGYPPVFALVKSIGCHVRSVAVTDEGLDLDALEALVDKKKIKMVFTTPHHQFPTTRTMTAPKRLRLYELATKYNFIIVEDDYDHEYNYHSKPYAPIASNDPYGHVIYLGTLSKIMFPSARVGFMSVPESFAEHFYQYRRLSTHQNDGVMQQALAFWIKEGGFERHLNKMRRTYKKRLQHLEMELDSLSDKVKSLSWQSPSGGMALWVDLGRNSSVVAKKALQRGVFLNPESYYRWQPGRGTHLRMGFSNLNEREISLGIKELSNVLIEE